MVFQIGSLDDSFADILITFFLRNYNRNIVDISENYLTCKFLDKSAVLLDLANLTLDYIIPQTMERILTMHYAFLTAEDHKDIHQKCCLRAFADRDALCLQLTSLFVQTIKTYQILSPDTAFLFYFKDKIKEWEVLTEEEVGYFLNKNEFDHIIDMLKRYADARDPRAEYIKIDIYNCEYVFLDRDANPVVTLFTNSDHYTADEKLLNGLLYLSPVHIDAQNISDTELKSILEEIFHGRISF